jgi:hypothetical protein
MVRRDGRHRVPPADYQIRVDWALRCAVRARAATYSAARQTHFDILAIPGHAGWLYGFNVTEPERIYRTKTGGE